jgi:hypothetical protein
MRPTHFTAKQVAERVEKIYGATSPNRQSAILSVAVCDDSNIESSVLWKVTWASILMSSDGQREVYRSEYTTIYIEAKMSDGTYLWPLVFDEVENWAESSEVGQPAHE